MTVRPVPEPPVTGTFAPFTVYPVPPRRLVKPPLNETAPSTPSLYPEPLESRFVKSLPSPLLSNKAIEEVKTSIHVFDGSCATTSAVCSIAYNWVSNSVPAATVSVPASSSVAIDLCRVFKLSTASANLISLPSVGYAK